MADVLGVWDFVTIAAYFLVVLVVGIWASCRPNRGSAAGYFLAGKDMHWIPVGCSIFASNVGAPMFIGLAGAAAATGFSVIIFEWGAVFLLIALGWLFVPVYVSSGAFTMPGYLKRRFGGVRLRIYLSILALILYVLTKISMELYAGALFMQQLIGWNIYICITAILVVTALYTVTGGLKAVMYTDTLQTVILMIGATILAIVGKHFDGFYGLQEKYMTAIANTTSDNITLYKCALPREDSFHIFRSITTGDLPWTGAVFGVTIFALWVWCSDQLMVQRCLSAKNYSHAKGGSLFAGFLKITPFFLWIIPGMIGRVLYPDEVACSSPEKCQIICGNKAGCSNISYPLLVIRLLPNGLRGLMLSALLAALMSSLTSIFNSASSMFTMDLWRRCRKKASEAELMVVGRLAVVVCVVFSIIWLPVLESAQGGQLWVYLQAVTACIAPPWTVVFLMAIFWKRTTEQGAFWGLIGGSLVGLPRLVLEVYYPAPLCGTGEPDLRPLILSKVHFSHFAIIISVVCAIIIAIVSLLTKPRRPEQLRKVTWWTRNDEQEPEISDTEDEDDDSQDEREYTQSKYESQTTSSTDRKGVLQPRSCKRILVNWLCGTTNTKPVLLSSEERASHRKKMTSLTEDLTSKSVVNSLAIGLCLTTFFLLGFYC
ncbi:hypothetical protein LOTGIDRAFT_141995 [Lottia gigantea]|uniref:Sodium/glucose cotransporter 5 n=1 Tax=Lottia gigantea TaxID=225164 RepID=V4APR5_LOTGI|nr:hypothetical protein LOTGIDRAFT_141995 [Lottia gigantea]ESO99197.1 hypothetical protein LOTGIDRAFT_141995 [Lottia gigantea]